MQLRGAVKAPRRLENETAYEEIPRVARRTRGRVTRRCVDYNPNLPPAAFPTLEKPRTSQEHDNESTDQDGTTIPDNKRAPVTPVHNHNAYNLGDNIKMAERDLAGIPSDSLESSIASNGDLNPIYQKNMMKMANAGDAPAIYEDMDDSDSEYHSDDPFCLETQEARPITNPKWNDLSPRIQVEIFDNLCKDYGVSVTSQILGLTDTEHDKTQVYIAQRENQINVEDLQLQRMRDRQLSSLLKIDNSDPKQCQTSHKVAFHRISQRYSHKLGEALKIDFFSCHEGELVNAQRFLDQRGLCMDYAGEWCNGTSVWRKIKREEQASVRRTSETKNDAEDQITPQTASIHALPSDASRDCLETSLPKQERHMPKYPGRPKDLFMRQGDWKLLSEQLLISCEENTDEDTFRDTLSGNGPLRKQASNRRVNRLCESEYPYIEPLKLVKTLPPMIRWHYSKPPSMCNIPEKPADQITRHNSASAVTSSARVRQNLEKARTELQQQSQARAGSTTVGRDTEAESDDDRSSACSLLVGQAIFSDENCSGLASPGRVIREKSPGVVHAEKLFPLEDTSNARGTSEKDDSTGTITDGMVAAPGDESRSPSPSPSSFGFHDQSMTNCMQSSPDAKLAGNDGESDVDDCDDGDVDEMVLVPTGLRKMVD